MKDLTMLKFALFFCALGGLSSATSAQVLKCTGENHKGEKISLSAQIHSKNKSLTVGSIGDFKATTWNDVLVNAERKVKTGSITSQYVFTLDRVTGQFSYSKNVDVLSATEEDLKLLQGTNAYLGFAFLGVCEKAVPLF